MKTVSVTKIKDGDSKEASAANDHKDVESASAEAEDHSNEIKMDVSALMNLLDKNGKTDDVKKTSNVKKQTLNLSVPKESKLPDNAKKVESDEVIESNLVSESKLDINIESDSKIIKQISQEEKLEKLRKGFDVNGNQLASNRFTLGQNKSRDVSKSSVSRIAIFVIFLILMAISFAGVVYFVDGKTKTWNNTEVENSSKSNSIKTEKENKIIAPTKQLKTEEEKQLLNIISNIN